MDKSPEQIAREQSMEMARREMYRRSLDTYRLYNPLDYPFRYMFDGFWHSVPAKGYKDEPQYLALHYFKKIAQIIIGEQATKKGEELKKLREKQFGKSFLDKYEENREVWDKVPKLDDPDLLKEIYELVIVGLVDEYGMDLPAERMDERQPIDLRSLQDQIFTQNVKRVPREMPTKKDLEKEVSQ